MGVCTLGDGCGSVVLTDTTLTLFSSPTQELSEQIAHLRDQLQELKAKTSLEAKYVKKESQVIAMYVAQG